jgi:hypothetical protein
MGVRSVASPYNCGSGASRARRSTGPWKWDARRLHKRHTCLASPELMPPRSHAGDDRQSDATGSEAPLRCRSWLGQQHRPAIRLLLAQRSLRLSWPTTHPAWRATIVCIAVGPLHPRCLAPKNTLFLVVAHFTSAPCKLSCQCHRPGPRTWEPFCDEQAGSWPILSGKCFHVLALGVRRSLFVQRTM